MPASKCESSTVQVQKECQQYLVFQLAASFLEVKQAKLTSDVHDYDLSSSWNTKYIVHLNDVNHFF